MRKWILMVAALAVLFLPTVAAGQETLPPWRRELPDGRERATITVGTTEIEVDLARSSEEQQLGLGYRNGLDENTGMLFTGAAPITKTFWMKGMRFCLDIIWIQDGIIVGAAENACPDPAGTADQDRARFSSGVPVTHVLEMPAGWMEAHGYGPGTVVDLGEIAP